jgi:RHS repeat-associated protein
MNKKTYRKSLALLLVAALVVTSFPSYVFGYANLEDTTRPVVATGETLVDSVEAESGIKYDPNYKGTMQIEEELLSKRGEFEKHFVQSDGSVLAVSYPQKVHYLVDGVWTDIDSRLELKDKEKGLYEPTSSDFKVSLPSTATADILIPASGDTKSSIIKLSSSYLSKVTDGEYSISWNILGNAKDYTSDFLSKATSKSLENTQIPSAALTKDAQPDISKLSSDEQKTALPNLFSTATYKDVVKNVDVDVVVTPDKLKENLIIKSPKGFTSISYLINAGNLSGAIHDDNSVTFSDGNGNVIFTIPTPYMFDGKIMPDDSINIKLALSKTTEGYLLTITPDSKWMNDPERVYPVTLDPTVTTSRVTSNILDTYVHSGDSAGDHKYSSYIRINKTDGATCRGYIDFANRPTIDTNTNDIIGGDLIGYLNTGTNTYHSMTIYQPTSAWTTAAITWANKPGNSAAIATVNGQTGGTYIKYTFPVDASVKTWYSTGVNNGYMIKYTDESINDYNVFYASDHSTISSSYYPCMVIEYAPDTTLPIVSSFTTNPATTSTAYTTNDNPVLSWSITENHLSQVQYAIDSGSYTNISTSKTGTYTIPDGKITTSGTYSIKLRALDASGNYSAVSTKSYYFDVTAPTFSSFALAKTTGESIPSGSWTNVTNPIITINNIADANAGINTTDASAIKYGIRLAGSTDAVTFQSPAVVTYATVNGSLNCNFNINLSVADGTYNIYVRVYDKVGKYSEKVFSYKKDTVNPPGLIKTTLSGSSTDTSNLKGTVVIYAQNIAEDEFSDLASGKLELYKVLGTTPETFELASTVEPVVLDECISILNTTLLDHGTYEFRLSLNETSGNTSVITKTVTIENPIAAPIITGPTSTYSNTPTLEWHRPSLLPVQKIQYRVGDIGDYTEITIPSNMVQGSFQPILPDQPGEYDLSVRFVDMKGEGLPGLSTSYHISIDRSNPVVSLTSFADGKLNGTITEDHLKSYMIYIKALGADDSTYIPVTATPVTAVGNPLGIVNITGEEFEVDGHYVIKVEATDNASNVGISTLEIVKSDDEVCPVGNVPEIILKRPTGQSNGNTLIRYADFVADAELVTSDSNQTPNPWSIYDPDEIRWFSGNSMTKHMVDGVLEPYSGNSLPLTNGPNNFVMDTSYELCAVLYDAQGNPSYSSKVETDAYSQSFSIVQTDWTQNIAEKTISLVNDSVSFWINAPATTETSQAISYFAKLPGDHYRSINPGERVEINDLNPYTLYGDEVVIKAVVDGDPYTGNLANLKLREDNIIKESIHRSVVQGFRANDLYVSDQINYKTYLRWEIDEDADENLIRIGDSQNNASDISYNIYRGTSENFLPSESTLIASGITENYYSLLNNFHSIEYFYKVIAVDDNKPQATISAMSTVSSTQEGSAADADEYAKRLGLKDHWEYAEVDMPTGDISIEKSKGNLVFEQVDATLPNEQLPVYFKRTYNSQSSVKSNLGNGWNHNFDMALLGIGDSQSLDTIAFRDESGTIFIFDRFEGNVYYSSLKAYLTLTKEEKTHNLQFSGSQEAISIQTSFTMLTKDNVEYGFNSGGQLAYVGEPNGNFLVLSYITDSGLLEKVTTSKNLSMVFEYPDEENEQGMDPYLIESISLPDGSKLGYTYDSMDNLTKTTCYPSNYSVTPGEGETSDKTEYFLGYDEGYLSEIKDGEGNPYNIEYIGVDPQDGIDYGAAVSKVTYPDNTYMTFDYTLGTEAAGSSTTTKKYVPKVLGAEQVLTETDTFDYRKGHITKSTDPLGNETTYVYSGDFLLSTTTQIEYQTVNEGTGMVSRIFPVTKVETTGYDGLNQNVKSETYGDGSSDEYVYGNDSSDEATNDFPSEEIQRDSEGNIVSHLKYTFDGEGNVTEIEDVREQTKTAMTYNADGEVASEVESLTKDATPVVQNSTTTTYSFDAAGSKTENLTEICDGKTVVSVREYDPMGREVSTQITGYTGTVISSNNIAYQIRCTNTFDGYGRLTSSQKTEHKDGEMDISTTEERSYNKNGSLTWEKSYDSIEKYYTYDSMNQLIRVDIKKDDIALKTTLTSWQYEDVTTQTGGGGVAIENAFVTSEYIREYDPENPNLYNDVLTGKTYVNPLGQTVRELKSGVYTDYTYDKSGRLLSSYVLGSDPEVTTGGMLVVSLYDQDGNPIETLINPGFDSVTGNYTITSSTMRTSNGYTAGKLSSIKDPEGRMTAFTHDDMGRITGVYLPEMEGVATSAIYDEIVIENGLDTDKTKDTLTDARGNQRYVITDALDQVLKIQDVGAGTDGNLITTFEYDEKGNKTKEIYGEENFKEFSYDSKDRLMSTCVFDGQSALKLKTIFTYDLSDNLRSMVDYSVAGGTETPFRYTYYDYDNLKRLVRFGEYSSNSQPTRNELEETRYEYDIHDNLTQMDYPESASQVDSLEFVYNSSNRWLTEIKLKRDGDTAAQTLRQYTYNRFGDVETIADTNPSDTFKTITRSYTYDQYGRPTKEEIRDSVNGTVVMESYELEYDKVSNVIKETIVNNYHVDAAKRGTEVREYSYDALDQLTSVLVKRGETTTSQAEYTYDLVGNRLSEIKDGEATTYVYNSLNQLMSSAKETVVEEGQTPDPLESKTYSYDANGAQVSVSDSLTNEMQESNFDAAGRLATYINKENGVITLTQENQYNGAGQRIKKTETAGSNPADDVNYFYQDGQVLYTTGSDANCAFNILGAGDKIIATEHQDENDIASYHFYNKDLMGSTTNILGDALTSEVTYDYDWFGNTEITNPENSDFYNQICYNGGVYDKSTQLYYFNARFYNPADGRFLSQDTYRGTLQDANSWHLYTYCANNPVKYSDPSGHFIQIAIAIGFGIWSAYDYYKEYKKAKKDGKDGSELVMYMGGVVVKDLAFGKVKKAKKIGKVALISAKKIFKSKVIQKAIKKSYNSTHGRHIVTHKISNTCKLKGAGKNGKFENASYHGKTGNSVKSKAPNNGQAALDNSVSIGENTTRRVGVSDGEIVVLDETGNGVFHGHVRSWGELSEPMKSALRKAGLVNKKGKVIK